MPIRAPKKGGLGVLAPEGNHRAACVGIYDIGTQQSEFYGAQRKLVLSFELVDETMPTTIDHPEERPFMISGFYTLSLNEKSNLRKLLESWRGRAFTDRELEEVDGVCSFDIMTLLGKPGLVNVVHEVGKKDGVVRARISTITKLPKGMSAPEDTFNPAVAYALDVEQDIPDSVPKWILEMIQKSEEWRDHQHGAPKQFYTQAEADKDLEGEDDIPF